MGGELHTGTDVGVLFAQGFVEAFLGHIDDANFALEVREEFWEVLKLALMGLER